MKLQFLRVQRRQDVILAVAPCQRGAEKTVRVATVAAPCEAGQARHFHTGAHVGVAGGFKSFLCMKLHIFPGDACPSEAVVAW